MKAGWIALLVVAVVLVVGVSTLNVEKSCTTRRSAASNPYSYYSNPGGSKSTCSWRVGSRW